MYKIMLADDEGIVIDSLEFIIRKEFGDKCAVQYARTGRSVIELAERFRPDIAIMDIQMPGINGIEAMKEIRKNNGGVLFIVMSAYDKFDYAKEAIKLGVIEYITKPMERTKIIATLKKGMDMIDREREKRSNDLLVKEKLETVVPIIESGLIYNILLQENFAEDIDNYKTVLGLRASHAYMMAVVCGDEQVGSHMTNAVGSSVRMQKHYQEVRECLKEYFDCIVGTVMANKLAVLVPFEKDRMEYNERIDLIERARALVRYMRKRTDINFRIGIGRVGELQAMAESYNEALNALVITTGSAAHADDLPIGCDYAGDYPRHLEKKLFENLEKGDANHVLSMAKGFYDWMVESNSDNMMAIRLKVLEFTLYAEYIAYQKGGMTYQFTARQEYLPTVMGTVDLGILREWFLGKIMDACQNVLGKQEEKSNSIIEMSREYIRNNFNKDISLDEVSRVANISPYYFSKIFKEGTGQNFIEYLTGIRMEKAKELLSTTEYSMKEICSMCGYADPNYFSRTFKKNVGVTPTEYKNV
ncbi:MAG: response regulator [Blautia sp.]|nr:response regulator [Blautia sp.]MCM1201334.1 response regulator [Bacteroides fragilis]